MNEPISGKLTPDEIEYAKILSNPVDFAEFFLGWQARWYQRLMLLHPSKRKVIRAGRRTGKSDAAVVLAIWHAFTHANSRVIVATPMEAQVSELFERMRQLIRQSPEISNDLEIDRRHPQTLAFHNGSQIKGFTSGTKSGAEGMSLRGQRADWIILDEVDYMSDADVSTIQAIALENPDKIGMWVSSTPSGKRGPFYYFCMDARAGKEVAPGVHQGKYWTEFYYPTTVNPNWGPHMESEFRSMWDDNTFNREVYALFGEEDEGVFPKAHLDQAAHDYAYNLDHVMPGRIRTMGVDWDESQATPTIVVLEYDPSQEDEAGEKGILKVVLRESVPRSEFTLDNAVNRIVELNGIFQPSWIYVDRGYGSYQVERLQILGKEAANDPSNPAHGLDWKVRGTWFKESITITDPATGNPIKKEIKPWMVNLTKILFSRAKLWISSQDQYFRKQLEDFKVQSVGQYGRPIYSSKNEHGVDALMLAVLAFNDKYPELAKILNRYRPNIGIIQLPAPERSEPKALKGKQNSHPVFNLLGVQPPDPSEPKGSYPEWFRVSDLRSAHRYLRRGSFARGSSSRGGFRRASF